MGATPREEVMRHYVEEETEGLNFSEYGTDLTDLPTFLQKPVSPNEINKAISRLLNTKLHLVQILFCFFLRQRLDLSYSKCTLLTKKAHFDV